jgi:hypothetical protein
MMGVESHFIGTAQGSMIVGYPGFNGAIVLAASAQQKGILLLTNCDHYWFTKIDFSKFMHGLGWEKC